jgi:TRAP-type C4-dicarboxylate transport system substrate-binding protein
MLSRTFAVGAAILGLSAGLARAEPLTLKFATINPPTSDVVTEFLKPWADRVSAASNGTLKIDVFNGFAIANNVNAYDRVVNDVVQIAYFSQIYAGGKFPRTDVVSLPFIADRSAVAAPALWRLYESGMIAPEYTGLKPLMMIVFPQQGIHTGSKPVAKVEDMAGLRIRTGSKVTAQIISASGATPLSIEVGSMYEAVQRGTVDGVFMPWSAFQPFKLAEVTHQHLDAPLGTSPAMIFMTQKTYDALPPDARKAIDLNSGLEATRAFGRWWDGSQDKVRNQIKASAGHTVRTLSAADAAHWRAVLAPIADEWAQQTPDGAKVLAAYRDDVMRETAGTK